MDTEEDTKRDKVLEKKFLEKLILTIDKMARKNFKNPCVFTCIQVAAIDFLGSVIMANSKSLVEKVSGKEAPPAIQLDYVANVKELTDTMFDEVKKQIRSVDLL